MYYFYESYVYRKKWKVEVNYKSRASVIITLIHIIPNTMDPHRLQKIPELSPKMWLDFSETGVMLILYVHPPTKLKIYVYKI